jgi:hypothetical protein
MKPDIPRASMSEAERRLRNQAAQLLDGAGLLHGSLVERTRVCGKPTCRCTRGQGHRALILTVRGAGRVEQIYVPPHLEATVRRWVEQDRKVRDLLGDLGQLHCDKVRELKARGAPSSNES